MKIILATILAATVLLAQANARPEKRDVFTSTWHSIEKFENKLVHKTFPKLLGYGKAGVTALRHLAIELTEETLGFLKKEYKVAKEIFIEVVHSDEFDELVNELIPLIDSETSIHACVVDICQVLAKPTTDRLSEEIADTACPPLCKGALTKLRHAAETLEKKLHDGEPLGIE